MFPWFMVDSATSKDLDLGWVFSLQLIQKEEEEKKDVLKCLGFS